MALPPICTCKNKPVHNQTILPCPAHSADQNFPALHPHPLLSVGGCNCAKNIHGPDSFWACPVHGVRSKTLPAAAAVMKKPEENLREYTNGYNAGFKAGIEAAERLKGAK